MAAAARGMAMAAGSILGICRTLDKPRQGLAFGESGFTPSPRPPRGHPLTAPLITRANQR